MYRDIEIKILRKKDIEKYRYGYIDTLRYVCRENERDLP